MSIFQYDYYPLLGGIQKIKADIQLTKISDTTYKVKSKIYILDWYGSDKEDIEIISKKESAKLDEINSELNKIDNINSFENRYLYLETYIKSYSGSYKVFLPGLEAFFMLQHRFGCKPFAIQIIYTDEQIIDTAEKNND